MAEKTQSLLMPGARMKSLKPWGNKEIGGKPIQGMGGSHPLSEFHRHIDRGIAALKPEQ